MRQGLHTLRTAPFTPRTLTSLQVQGDLVRRRGGITMQQAWRTRVTGSRTSRHEARRRWPITQRRMHPQQLIIERGKSTIHGHWSARTVQRTKRAWSLAREESW